MPVLLALDFVVLATVACYHIVKVYKKEIERFHVAFALGATVLFVIAALLLEMLATHLSSGSLLSFRSFIPYSHFIGGYFLGYLLIVFVKKKEARTTLKYMCTAIVIWHASSSVIHVYKDYKRAASCPVKSMFQTPGYINGSPHSDFWRNIFYPYVEQQKKKCDKD